MTLGRLHERAVIRIDPRDPSENAHDFLQGLLTNDVTAALPVYAALLSAQGKTMFEMIVWRGDDGAVLLDCEATQAEPLVKRLSLYRLRRKLEIARDDGLAVYWSPQPFTGAVSDPRLAALGYRAIAPLEAYDNAPLKADNDASGRWLAHRLSLGVPEGNRELGDILWLETNAAELNGVSFTKGCYIGQENTARMNWRQKINRRLLVVPLSQSDPKRQKIAYRDLGFALDHLRMADIDTPRLPPWLQA